MDTVAAQTQGPMRRFGPIATAWDGDGPMRAIEEGKELLLRARPPTIMVHAWEAETPLRALRTMLPSTTAYILGVGVDGIAKRVAKGEWSVAKGVQTMLTLAARAVACRCVAIMWNAEGGWKRTPRSDEAARLRDLIRQTLREVARQFPQLAQLFTSYDHPSFHSSFPFPEWVGAESPIVEAHWQVYAAGLGKEVYPHRGALPAREKSAIKSYNEAVRKRLIKPDVVDGAPGDDTDLDWRPYVQLHHVHAADTVALAVRYPSVSNWAVMSRTDKHGRAALVAQCELWHRGFWGEGAVERFQVSAGLNGDGVLGPRTAAALGMAEWWPPAPPAPLVIERAA